MRNKRWRRRGRLRREIACVVSNPGIPVIRTVAGAWAPFQGHQNLRCCYWVSWVWRFYHSLYASLSVSFFFFFLSHFSTSLCTSSKMRAFLKTHPPVHAGALNKWLPRMDLYYFTKKHQRRNLFCSTNGMISSPLSCLSSVFFFFFLASPWEKDREKKRYP